MGHDGFLPVNLYLRDQVDARALLDRVKGMRLDARRRLVIRELRSFDETSRADLLDTLEAMEKEGIVSRIRPFWIINGVNVQATREAVEQLAGREDIS